MTAHFTLPRQKAEDDSNNPISGAKLYFFDVDTTNPRTVYQDSNLTTAHGVFVQADANGLFPPIYPPIGDYDVLMTDGSDAGNNYLNEVTIRAKISTKGPVDLSSFQTNMAKSETPAITKATDYIVVEADRGKAIDVNPNSATVTITLESSSVAGDGSEITIKHNGNSNAVILSTVNGELIDGHARYVLVRPGSSVTLRADGANWKIKSETVPNAAILHSVTHRKLTSPPTSPVDGSKYIMSDSSLVGQWASYSSGDLVIYAGSGVYQLIAKLPGDRAYIIDENMDTRWTGSVWEDLSNITAPQETVIKTARFELRRALGVDGKAVVANAWTSRGYMVELSNNIAGLSSDANGIITLAAGTYYISATQVQYAPDNLRTRFVCLNNTEIKIESEDLYMPTATALQINLSGTLVVTEQMVTDGQNTFDHQYFRSDPTNNQGLGWASSIGEHEHYGNVQVINLKSIQGPRGDQGPQGFPGADGAPGAPGADGSDGVSSIFNDASEPAGGNNGDIWIRSTDGQYHKKISESWVDQGFSVKGATGDAGPAGPAGSTPGYSNRSELTAAEVPLSVKATWVMGYSNAGDGGHSLYTRVNSEPSHEGKIRSTDRYLPDGTTDATNGGWWEADLYPVNPKVFGAVGDGVTDDTTAFMNAVAALSANGALFVPAGIYVVNDTISLVGKNGVSLYGEGWGTSIIKRTDGTFGDTLLFASSNPSTTQARGLTLKDLQFWAEVDVTTGATVHIQNSTRVSYHNIFTRNCHRGIHLEGIRDSRFDNFEIISNEHHTVTRTTSCHLLIDAPADTSKKSTETFFSNFNFTAANSSLDPVTNAAADLYRSIYIRGELDGIWIQDGHMFGAANSLVTIDGNNQSDMSSIVWDNVWFDQYTARNLTIQGSTSVADKFRLMSFKNCRFWGGGTNCVASDAASNIKDVTFKDCELGQTQGMGVQVGAGEFRFLGCSFDAINLSDASNGYALQVPSSAHADTSLTVIGCEFICPNLTYGIECAKTDIEYRFNSIEFTGQDGNMSAEILFSGNNLNGSCKNISIDRNTAGDVTAATSVTLSNIATDDYNLEGSTTSVSTIYPTWHGRVITIKSDTANQNMVSGGNIRNKTNAASVTINGADIAEYQWREGTNRWHQR